MMVLGLTGSIGMGKTTAAQEFKRQGIPVFDSDATVHRLLAKGGAGVPLVSTVFPGVLKNEAIDRAALGERVFGAPEALSRLENVVHPLVRKAQSDFLRSWARRRVPLVLYDIPLLFETGAEVRCDAVATVSAPFFVQAQRVLARPGMTLARLDAILQRQTPDMEKRQRADFIIMTGMGRACALRQIASIIRVLRQCKGHVWPAGICGSGVVLKSEPNVGSQHA